MTNDRLKEAIYWVHTIFMSFFTMAVTTMAIEKTLAIIRERRWVYTYELYNEKEG
ncbi:hypothetical protein [Alphaspiravirus yamagawaense]|uniref:Uncharacterized protein n=1 Tax=Alphaspiravirus yamagawaense TaxID=1157339 RepID=J7Q7J0_9VIRU|nr:hypothetical protein [Aeropyrum coil-shaped virus]CCG27837.1 hypothetical protein [Aeropyrum coil-shaped virus]